MRAIAVTAKNEVRFVTDVPMPVPGPYDCLLKIRACGFCSGTDMHIIRGEMTCEMDPFPVILGHEGVAEVVETGSRVRHYHVGDRFINPPEIRTSDQYGLAWGHMSDFSILQDQQAMREDGLPDSAFFDGQKICTPIPRDLNVLDAGVLLTLSECLSAAKNFNVRDKNVLVYGAGPMGLATMRYMKLLGAKKITSIDCIRDRLKMAEEISGADRTINYAEESVTDVLGEERFDRVVDLVGSSSVLMEGSTHLAEQGVLCSMGVLRKGDTALDVSRLPNNAFLQMLNFPSGQYQAIPENIELIRRGEINPKQFYSHVKKPEEIGEVIELITSRSATKIVLDFDL